MQLNGFSEKVLKLVFYLVVCWILDAEARYKRRCKGSEMDILTSSGVKIEPIALSRVFLPKLTKKFSSDGHKLTFDFRTTSPSGLLFYGIQSVHFRPKLVALQMVNGILYFIVRCPSADVELRLPVPKRLNDGQWHTVEFRRKGRKGFVTVDGDSYFRHYPVTCKLNSFVFGGIDASHARAILPVVVSSLTRTRDHFDGCIRNVNFNHGILDSAPQYFAVSTCS